MKSSLVSVVIPVYNSERYVAEAIESVLRQSYSHFEIIVVDDGSVDGTAGILKGFKGVRRVRVLRHPRGRNLGVSRSRRLGVSAAAGEFVAFLDADDLFAADKLDKQVEILTETPELVMCHSGVVVVSSEKEVPDFAKTFSVAEGVKRYRLLDQDYAFQRNQICNSSVMVRREFLTDLVFDADQIFQFEDWLLWLLLSEKGDFVFLPDALVHYRYHHESATAGVYARPIKYHYSLLEMQLSLLTRLSNTHARAQVLAEFRRNLVDLVVAYSPQGRESELSSAVETVTAELFSFGDEDIASMLALTVNRLEAEQKRLLQRSQAFESSLTWKIVKAIQDRFGRRKIFRQLL